MTSIPAQSAQPTSAGSALVPGTLFRANQPGHYVVRESGLCAAGKLPLSAVPELQRVPPTRNSWLRAGDPLGLVSDLVLRRVATDGAAANERLFAPYSVCELLCPSLTMFELPRSAHRHLGCRTGLLQGELQDASGRPIAQPTTSIAFFVADVEATGDLEQLLATVHIVHDLRTESDR